MGPASNSTSQRSGAGLRVVAAVAVIVCASMLGAAAHAGTDAAVPAATLRDPAHDVRAGDIDLTTISVSKRDGALVVRFTVRGPVTDDVSYTASVRAGVGSCALVARRSAGADSFLLYNLSTGATTNVTGAIEGRTARVRAPISQPGGRQTRRWGDSAPTSEPSR
jgi:hypothetical protein